jgi:hypothetical protein
MRILLCFLLTCSVIATDAQAQTAKESQAAAVAAIKKLGGTVTFDKKNPGRPIVSVDLSFTKVTDAGLVQLKGLTKLQTLYLARTKVTGPGREHLKGLTNRSALPHELCDSSALRMLGP